MAVYLLLVADNKTIVSWLRILLKLYARAFGKFKNGVMWSTVHTSNLQMALICSQKNIAVISIYSRISLK